MNKNIMIQDKIRGSLIGGAAGDALGYSCEFLSDDGIMKRYGSQGIRRFDTSHWWNEGRTDAHALVSPGKAWISDDTQMTLYTAMGMLNANKSGYQRMHSICEAYVEWYFTQAGQIKRGYNQCWISDIPELRTHRAAGHTCINSLKEIYKGHEPYNNSKGCGGVMRVAPIPLAFIADGGDINEIARMAGDSAYITHKNPCAYIPAAIEACIIYRLGRDLTPTRDSFKNYIAEGISISREIYPRETECIDYLEHLIDKAIRFCNIPFPDIECIYGLGEGWCGHDALAIAIYCAYKYFDDFEAALIAAVNHKGDSDSTGAVTGNILGAAIGYDDIPQFFKDALELHDVILHVADDLWRNQITKFEKTDN